MVNLLTWNIQAAIGTGRTLDYVFRAHRQLVHTRSKTMTLRTIAREIAAYDVVCLQEIDLGGRRAGFRSQLATIAAKSGHAHVAVQLNRIVPGVSRHGNAILSRWPLRLVHDIKLPGRIGGRGCLVVDVDGPVALRVACLHLSLGEQAQLLQLAAVAQALRDTPAWLAMGDFNCAADSAPLQAFCAMTGGGLAGPSTATYPSWRPRRDFDHIVGSRDMPLTQYRTMACLASDHLPVSARIAV